MEERTPGWDFAVAAPGSAPGVVSMVGYRALEVPDAVHRGLPSPWLTFIVSLDDGVQAADTAEALATAAPAPLILGGLHVRASHVRQCSAQSGVQLAVHPLASRALFGRPCSELSVADFDASAVLGRPARQLWDRLTEGPAWPEAFALVAGYLVQASRDRPGSAVRPELAHAWDLLERSRGRAGVTWLAEQVGVTPRHLSTLFRLEVGRSPKTVAMLMRFQHATARITQAVRQSGRVDLAGVAAATGYCDQAHLCHEFVRFAGVPPRVWLAEEFRNIQDGGHGDWSEYEHDEFEPDGLVGLSGH